MRPPPRPHTFVSRPLVSFSLSLNPKMNAALRVSPSARAPVLSRRGAPCKAVKEVFM